jgi:hypothetical protein
MFATRSIITDVRTVPETWIFEYFCKLSEQLNGNEVRIKSLFNAKDNAPSMFIFTSDKYKKWWFHDFSTGKTGDSITLVRELYKCTYGEACGMIQKEYSKFLLTGSYNSAAPQPRNKYRVTASEVRQWNVLDASFWMSFNVGSVLLEQYHVRPLQFYEMTNESNSNDYFRVQGEHIYGYYTPQGELYKIYCPKKKEQKFIKVKSYIQGIDQLEDKKCLIVTSSMKDGLSLKSLGLDLDFVAPDSENSMLTEMQVSELYDRYEGRMYTLLDNDDAGIKAMKKYKERYGLKPILLHMAKDLSDSVRDFEPLKVSCILVPKIDHLMNAA